MARILVTGMSGAGKSTLLHELARRGYLAVDTDYEGWHVTPQLWDVARMNALLASNSTLAVSGTAENQGAFYDRFEHVVYFLAPLDVLLERVAHRSNNPYGKSDQHIAEIAGYVATVEPLIRQTASIELDATRLRPRPRGRAGAAASVPLSARG